MGIVKNIGGISRWEFFGWEYSGGNSPEESLIGGNFPGESFPDADKNVIVKQVTLGSALHCYCEDKKVTICRLKKISKQRQNFTYECKFTYKYKFYKQGVSSSCHVE